MSSLFVAEDSEQPASIPHVKLEPGLEENGVSVKREKEDTSDVMKKIEDQDIEMKFYDDEASDSEDEDPEDPIVDTIPVHLNVPSNNDNNENQLAPLLLQFPTKSRQSHLTQNHISALHKLHIKPDSGVVELRLPLDTNNFFSETVSNKYNVSEQFLRGVIIHDEPVGTLSDGTIPSISVMKKNSNCEDKNSKKIKQESRSISMNDQSVTNPLTSIRTQPGSVGGSRYLVGVQDKEGRLHLTPLSDTCMLRPHFSYIDQTKMSKMERERERERELQSGSKNNNGGSDSNNKNNGDDSDKKRNVSVVTMSAKSTNTNIPRLGGALLSAKLESEEEGSEFNIIPCNEDFINSQFIETSGNVLNSKLSQDQYLDILLHQTQLE